MLFHFVGEMPRCWTFYESRKEFFLLFRFISRLYNEWDELYVAVDAFSAFLSLSLTLVMQILMY